MRKEEDGTGITLLGLTTNTEVTEVHLPCEVAERR